MPTATAPTWAGATSTGTGNELTSDGTYNYTYDNNGNMLTQTEIATGSVTYYTWDYQNRLTEVKAETSGGTVLNDETFTYDVNDNRIGVSLNGTQQLYTVYDGSNPYMDFNGSGTLTERYLTNPNGLNQFYGQVSASGTTEWFLTDNLELDPPGHQHQRQLAGCDHLRSVWQHRQPDELGQCAALPVHGRGV